LSYHTHVTVKDQMSRLRLYAEGLLLPNCVVTPEKHSFETRHGRTEELLELQSRDRLVVVGCAYKLYFHSLDKSKPSPLELECYTDLVFWKC